MDGAAIHRQEVIQGELLDSRATPSLSTASEYWGQHSEMSLERAR
jgi:hypothetical protein